MKSYQQVKKYFLYLAVFFFLVTWVHVGTLYLYHDAEQSPVKGGVAHVGFVSGGQAPSIDLLSFDPRGNGVNLNDMLISFLYRGVLAYRFDSQQIEEDLGNCGIDTFPRFTCTLNEDAVWSDGTTIETSDIVATYEFYKNFSKNAGLKSRLEKLAVSESDEGVVFTFSTSDITALDLLFLPVLKEDDIARFEQGASFSQNAFSGPYVFESRSVDDQTGIPEIVFSRNTHYTKEEVYLSSVLLHFYPSQEQLETHTEMLDIIFAPGGSDYTLGDSFETTSYLRPQYFGAFVNSDRVDLAERKALFHEVFSRQNLDSENYHPVQNVFFGTVNTPELENTEIFSDYLVSEGYITGNQLLEKKKAEHLAAQEIQKDENITKEAPQAIRETPKLITPKINTSKYITAPSSQDVHFITGYPLQITGSVPVGTNRVVVNNYTLKLFNAAIGSFSYRAAPEYANLREGKNEYVIQFYTGNTLLDEEVYTVYYALTEEGLQEYRDIYTPVETEVIEEVVEAIPEEVVDEEDVEPDFSWIRSDRYYDSNDNIYALDIVYPSGSSFLANYAQYLSKNAAEKGVHINISPASKEGIEDIISGKNREYDIILTGVYLGIFDYNIFANFHSGQAKSGYNFSQIRSQQLDTSLEKLRQGVYYSSPSQLKALKEEIITYITDQYIVYTLMTPYERLSVNSEVIRGAPEFARIPSIESLSQIMETMYSEVSYTAVKEDKSIAGFFSWAWSQLVSRKS